MSNFNSEWMKNGFSPISIPANRQSKVPGLGQDQAKGQSQTIDSGAQDDPAGFLGGVGDEVPGKTQRLSDCLAQGQDAGSNQAKVPSGGMLNVGASGEGLSAIDGTSPEKRSTKAPNRTFGNADIGVDTSSVNGMPPGALD